MASMSLMGLGFAPDGFSTVKKYDSEYTGDAKLGDLFMVKCGSSSAGSGLGYYHAGVYCSEEDEEIIHFTVSPSQSGSLGSGASSSFSSGPGLVSKVHVNMFCGQNQYAIYRKNEEIPKSFRSNVRKAMKEIPEYDLLENNCIHFAMELLNVDLQSRENYIKELIKMTTAISKGTNQELRSLPI